MKPMQSLPYISYRTCTNWRLLTWPSWSCQVCRHKRLVVDAWTAVAGMCRCCDVIVYFSSYRGCRDVSSRLHTVYRHLVTTTSTPCK